MKKEWKQPSLETLHIHETMKGGGDYEEIRDKIHDYLEDCWPVDGVDS
ncbi:paeninodin family lasso peptide [Halobacillus trueperi]